MQLGLGEEAKNIRRDYEKPKECTTVEECPGGLDSEVWIRTNDQGEMTSLWASADWLFCLFFSQDITIMGENKKVVLVVSFSKHTVSVF